MGILLNHPAPYLITAGFVAIMALYAWSKPHRPGNRYFYWIMGLWLVWAMASALSTIVPTTGLRYWMWVLQVFSVLLSSPVELMFSLDYTGNEKYLNRRNLALLTIPALLFILSVLNLPRNTFVSFEMRSGIEVIVSTPLTMWALFASNILIWFISVGFLSASLLRARAFSQPILLLIIGQAIPRIAFLASIPMHLTVAPVQIAILFSNFTALAYILALFNFRLLRVIPVARDEAISSMPHAMLVLDAENYLVDFNPAAQELPGLPGKLTLRQNPDRVLGVWWERVSPLIGPNPVSQDFEVLTGSGQQYFHVYGFPLLNVSGWRIGEVFILEDVTQVQQAQHLQAQKLWAQATFQEREQLAYELHDGLCQSLAFMNLQAQTAQIQIRSGQSQNAQISLERLTEAASQIQDDTREVIRNLLSVNQPSENFCATLRQILDGFEQQTGLATHLKVDDCLAATPGSFDSSQLPPPVAVQLIRITQEALTNVRKHAAGASKVTVKMKARDGQLQISIMDDGSGFDPAMPAAGRKHFGLQVMRQRAEGIGGQLEVSSIPGKGTYLEITAPLSHNGKRSTK